jgi:aminoglycoside phosphotransferase (APT) family kinase protein
MSDPARVDEHRRLTARLFEPLAPIASFEPVGDGWTCDTYRVDSDWIAQFPRSETAAGTLRKQMDVLPELARELSAAVPVPQLVSRDPAVMVYRRIQGDAATDASGVWPERFGRFLYDLHMVRPEYVGMRQQDPGVVRAHFEAELTDLTVKVFPRLTPAERESWGGSLGPFVAREDRWRFSPCVTHNDIGRPHILVAADGDLAGVIDWEEVGIGDPAADFAWLLGAEPDAGERALAAYGGAPDEGFRARCWFHFMLTPWRDIVHGLESGRPEIVEAGLAELRERGSHGGLQ